MNEAIDASVDASSAWEQIKARQSELLLKDSAMKDLLASMVMQAMGKPFEETMTFANVNNEGATYDKLLDALEAKEACRDVLQQSGWSEFDDFDATFFDPSSKSSACGFLSRADRLRLYRIFLKRSVLKSESGKELTDDNYAKVVEVKGMLGITDDDEADEFRMAFGPELQKVLNVAMFEIMGDDFTETLVTNMKESVDKVVKDYRLSDTLVSNFAAPIYMRAVTIVNEKVCCKCFSCTVLFSVEKKNISSFQYPHTIKIVNYCLNVQTPGGVPTGEKMSQLDALRDLLGMSKDDTYGAHLEVFGDSYKTKVSESMGSTGVITKEYREPLEKLRERLGVSEEDSRALYLKAMEERMVPMVEWIILELERTMLTAEQLAQKRKKDFGEDYFKTGKGADVSFFIC